MSLNDLIKHAKTQEEAIGRLSSGVSSETEHCASWHAFRQAIWGKGLEAFQGPQLVQRDTSDQVKRVALPDNHLVATVPATPDGDQDVSNRQILVRSEYEEATRAAVSLSGKPNRDVFVVIGQPGIGNSVFIRWLLMCRLALGLPTALQIDKSYAILFHEDGVFEFQDLMTCLDYNALDLHECPSRRIWALVDSGPRLPEPAGIFMDGILFFVVDAVSPRSKHLKWLKKLGHRRFYMEPWSLSEVIQARRFLGDHTEHQLLYMYERFGASPRELALHADAPAQYEARLHQEVDQLDPDRLELIFRDPTSHGSFDLIITTKPSSADRLSSKSVVASRHVLNLLWERHISHRADIMGLLYYLFRDNPINPPAAEWIFKLRMHQLLVEKQTLQLFYIRGRQAGLNLLYDNYTASMKRQDPTNFELAKSEQYHLIEKICLQKNRYYLPKSRNFPAIDSLLLVHPPGEPSPILLMFQITRNKKDHYVNKKSLRKINDLKLPPNTRKYYVVVTPEGVCPTITVPTEYPQDEEQQETSDNEETSTDGGREMSAGDLFSVFNYPVRMAELFMTWRLGHP